MLRIGVATRVLQLRPPPGDLVVGDEDIGGALLQVDAHAVAGPEQRQPAADRRFRRGVEDRGRARGARLAAVADAGQRMHALLDEIGRRLHVHHLGTAGIADRTGAAHEQDRALVDALRRVVDAGMVVLRPVEHDGLAFKGFRIARIRQVAVAELLRNHAGLHDCRIEQVAFEIEEAGFLHQRVGDRPDHLLVHVLHADAVLADRPAIDGDRLGMRQQPALDQFGHDRRYAAGMVVILAEIFARRLQVDEKRYLVADRLPVVIVQCDAEMTGDGVEVDRRVGGAADGRVDDDGVLERLAGHDVGRLQVLVDHLDDAPARLIGNLAPFAVGRGDGGGRRQLHAERLCQRIHRGRGAHGVAVADRGRGGSDDVHELVVVDLAGG